MQISEISSIVESLERKLKRVDCDKDYLTIDEACAYMCCSRRRFFDIKKAYGFTPGGPGKQCYRRRELQAFMESTFDG